MFELGWEEIPLGCRRKGGAAGQGVTSRGLERVGKDPHRRRMVNVRECQGRTSASLWGGIGIWRNGWQGCKKGIARGGLMNGGGGGKNS